MVRLCWGGSIERSIFGGRKRVDVDHALDELGVDHELLVDLVMSSLSGSKKVERAWRAEVADLSEEGIVPGQQVAVRFRQGVVVCPPALVGAESLPAVQIECGCYDGLVVRFGEGRGRSSVARVDSVVVRVAVGVRVRVLAVHVRHFSCPLDRVNGASERSVGLRSSLSLLPLSPCLVRGSVKACSS